MDDVKRYNFFTGGLGQEGRNADFVAASDFDAAQSELAALREELATAKRAGPPHLCGLPMSLNPHPEAGVPGRFLEVGTVSECIPCLVASRHGWAKTASELKQRLTAAEQRNAALLREVAESVTGRNGTFARIPADWFDRRDAGIPASDAVPESERLKGGDGGPVAWQYKEHVWATGLGAYVWRDKLETEKPGDDSEIKDLSPLFASQPAPVSVGYKLVPLMPTPAMVQAGIDTRCGDDEHQDYRDVYAAMVGAAQ
jgi:hypothetical protein